MTRPDQTEGKRDEMEDRFRARLAEILQSIERYYDAIATGLDPDVCKRKIEELNQQKSVLEGDLKDREAGLRIAQAFENDLTLIRSLAHNFMNEFDQLPFERQRMLTLHFVERIDILDHSIARVLLRIPKLTPGKTLKPPMAKQTRKEIELKGNSTAGKNRKTPLDSFDQVGSNMLPALT